ncbi:unnamed protein product [Effrenium voratum]|uniref:Uncharacterized protein n=1 Tax=Effrenium voratum TaxID=2562239 RepID=A0AA36IM23_9DINO|nr:unnamed protein product [Effrenium voratum]CAJ1459130.1 unnamed protein product [Effrenium voratum]
MEVGEQIAVAVVLAMTGQSLASFRAGSDCTAADVLQKLAREAPLPDGQILCEILCRSCVIIPVLAAAESFRELPGHLACMQRTCAATCTLLNIELKKKSAGLYGDFPSMVHPLPLLDRQGAARAFAEGLLEIKPLLDVLDRYRPWMRSDLERVL